LDRVEIVRPAELEATVGPGGADLLLLDVPCSNTAVLARRPAARYRCEPASLASLAQLQERIADERAPLLRLGGHLLYSTCSLLLCENGERARAIAHRSGATITRESLETPAPPGDPYHDGGYFALLQFPGARA
jgi:16S rRNA (cytosine967-C5)-methyltransferase